MSDPDALADLPAPERRQRARGHDNARATILERLAAGRLPGGILLHGPQGIGKATLAFELAAAILAATGDEDAHRVAEQVAALSHPNLFVLRRRPKDSKGFYTVIRVEDVRDLRDSMHRTRGRSGHRVAIIDPIDEANPSAANALLKTLEEPPADTTFLLISHRPGRLLPTIKSRCHVLALRPLGDADLRAVVQAEQPELASAELERAVALAGGRPRRAFETLALGPDSALGALSAWLQAPTRQPASVHLTLADALGADPQGPELSFAKEMLDNWMAEEARQAAIDAPNRLRLASANELWDKAHALLEDAESINLDTKQTLVIIFDAIRRHLDRTAAAPTEYS